jgi:hypothetical protein
MIYSTLDYTRCNRFTRRFSCGIVPAIGTWPAHAADEVDP